MTERWGRWLLWLKISSAQIFWFCNTTLQIFQHPENVKISIFPLHCPSRNAISSKVFNEFSKSFFWLKDEDRWLLWLKISSAQIFWFCNSNVTNFPTSRKCKNFYFSLYTVPAEMLYLQKYLMNFQKLSFGWKMRKVAIVVENFNCTEILVLKIATLHIFQHPENVKISIFPFTLSQQKCYIFKSI